MFPSNTPCLRWPRNDLEYFGDPVGTHLVRLKEQIHLICRHVYVQLKLLLVIWCRNAFQENYHPPCLLTPGEGAGPEFASQHKYVTGFYTTSMWLVNLKHCLKCIEPEPSPGEHSFKFYSLHIKDIWRERYPKFKNNPPLWNDITKQTVHKQILINLARRKTQWFYSL